MSSKSSILKLASQNFEFRKALISKLSAFRQDYDDVVIMAKNDGRFSSSNPSRRKPRSAVEAAQRELGLRLPHKDFVKAVKEVADIWKEEDNDPLLDR